MTLAVYYVINFEAVSAGQPGRSEAGRKDPSLSAMASNPSGNAMHNGTRG